jgi:hypothetical protein
LHDSQKMERIEDIMPGGYHPLTELFGVDEPSRTIGRASAT